MDYVVGGAVAGIVALQVGGFKMFGRKRAGPFKKEELDEIFSVLRIEHLNVPDMDAYVPPYGLRLWVRLGSNVEKLGAIMEDRARISDFLVKYQNSHVVNPKYVRYTRTTGPEFVFDGSGLVLDDDNSYAPIEI